jgi:hypothetical protein
MSTDAILTISVPSGIILGALATWLAMRYHQRKRNGGGS